MKKTLLSAFVILSLFAVACGAEPAPTEDPITGDPVVEQPTGVEMEVMVEDQAIEDNTVTISSVTSDGPGWIVIHEDRDGQPGAVIGYAAVEDGENTDVQVEFEEGAVVTDTLHAMLHVDAGTEGEYEFPGVDAPAEMDGELVVEVFTVTQSSEEATEEEVVTE